MIVTANKVAPAPVAAKLIDVKITLSPEEAKMLRRVCYYNKTVAKKFADNPVGGYSKSRAVDSFLNSLGNTLKTQGVDRY